MARVRLNIILMFLILPIANPFPLYSQSTTSIAVLDFEGRGISVAEAGTLADRLEAYLVSFASTDVVERSQMLEILKEQDFQLTGCTSDECAVEVGQLLGVTQMVAGSIGRIGETFSINIRMIEVESGRISKSIIRDYRGAIDGLLTEMEFVAKEITGGPVADNYRESPEEIYIEPTLVSQALIDSIKHFEIGDSVMICHVYYDLVGGIYHQEPFIRGSVTGFDDHRKRVWISAGKRKSIKRKVDEVLPMLPEISITNMYLEVGDPVFFYQAGFHEGIVSDISDDWIEIEYTQTKRGQIRTGKTTIPKKFAFQLSI